MVTLGRMRRAVLGFLVFALLLGCRGQFSTTATEQSPTVKPTGRQEIVYEIDLAKAVDDRAVSIRQDMVFLLDAQKIRAAIRVTATGIVITPEDPASKPAIEALLTKELASTFEVRPCGGADLCVAPTASMRNAIRMTALENAVKIIRRRLEAVKVRNPKVSTRGEQIVVEVDADDEKAKQMRALIARTGKLEFKIVDHNSTFMRDAYALAEKDPRAKELGIQGEIDQWRDDSGGSISIDYYFVAKDRAALEKYFAEIAGRDPRYKPADDRQLGYELAQGMWRSYYLERVAELTGRDVANAEGSTDPNTNRAIVLLDFTRSGGETLADVTARNVGRKLATILDDQVRSAPIINSTIRGGRVAITMGGSDPRTQEAERDELVQVLKTGSLPAPLREVH